MAISFMRIDERLIHGQIAVCWSRQYPCDGIIAVNDKAANNDIVKSALKAATSIKTYVWDYDTLLKNKDKIQESAKNYFIITKEPMTMAKILMEAHLVPLRKTVNVGPQSLRGEAISVSQETNITVEEVSVYEKIHQQGYSIQFQIVPNKSMVEWRTVRTKLVEEKHL